MAPAPWVECARCGHQYSQHGNTTTPTSECHATEPYSGLDGERMAGVVPCDCTAFVRPAAAKH